MTRSQETTKANREAKQKVSVYRHKITGELYAMPRGGWRVRRCDDKGNRTGEPVYIPGAELELIGVFQGGKHVKFPRKAVIDREWSEQNSGDGYWILLVDGYHVDNVHAIHEDTKRAAYDRIRDVRLCSCADCKKAAAQ